MSEIAERCRRGHEIAVQIVNESGGIKSLGNASVSYEYVDSGDKPEGAVLECERLIRKEKIPIITGCYASSLTIPAAKLANEYKIPFVISDATADELTQSGFHYVFRASATNTIYCKTALDFAIKELKAKTLGVVYIDLLMGRMLVTDIEKRAKQLGLKVVLKAPYGPDARDFKTIIQQMKDADPDIIVAASYVGDAVLIAHQIHEESYSFRSFVGMGAGHAIPEFLKSAQDDSEYFSSVAFWCHDMITPGSKELTQRYFRKYGEYPIEHPGSCFQASQVLLNAIERAGSTNPEEIREALSKTDMMTIAGKVKIDPATGQNSMAGCGIVQVQKGQFATVWPEGIASKKPIFPRPKWEGT